MARRSDLTVVGNAVNVASRLEALSKEKAVQIVMSADVARHAGCLDDAGPADDGEACVVVDEPMSVIGVTRGRDLPASILSSLRRGRKKRCRVGVARMRVR
jgi:adenylate cyclase